MNNLVCVLGFNIGLILKRYFVLRTCVYHYWISQTAFLGWKNITSRCIWDLILALIRNAMDPCTLVLGVWKKNSMEEIWRHRKIKNSMTSPFHGLLLQGTLPCDSWNKMDNREMIDLSHCSADGQNRAILSSLHCDR